MVLGASAHFVAAAVTLEYSCLFAALHGWFAALQLATVEATLFS